MILTSDNPFFVSKSRSFVPIFPSTSGVRYLRDSRDDSGVSQGATNLDRTWGDALRTETEYLRSSERSTM